MSTELKKKKDILIIDDDILTAQATASRIMVNSGLTEVSVCGDPVLAVDIVSKKQPDLILLDYMMPSLSGIECLIKIRKLYSKLELPIIMMTSEEASENLVKAFEEGVNDYIVKGSPMPVVMSRLNAQFNIVELAQDRLRLHELQAVMALVISYNHEINNPLTAAIGNLNAYKGLGEKRRYEIMEESLWRIADVVKNLKELGEKQRLEFEKYIDNTQMIKIKKDSKG